MATSQNTARGRSAKRKLNTRNNLVYDVLLWAFSIIIDLFFREIHPRSSWKIPRRGPVLFVAAPHANQFVDPLILMRVIRKEAHRRIAFLIAEKSMRRKFIGWAARSIGALPVGRALDMTRSASGTIYLPDPVYDPTLVRGVDTKFDTFQVGGLIVLPSVNNASASSEIQEIISPEELRLKKPFSSPVAIKQMTGRDVDDDGNLLDNEARSKFASYEGTSFKVAPKVDQTEVYDAVFERLMSGGCIGIFPEGGSHDRTELLPLKPGVAIMALGALAVNPDCGVTIVPCGMNYFHPHKFRSRAVIEFGQPVKVPQYLVDMYKEGRRREAIGELLEIVYQALVSVTVTSPDYDTLMLIQAVRRLYNPKGKKLPLPMVVELNRRLVKGYTKYKEDPRIVSLKRSVLKYNKRLEQMNIRDHQVDYAKLSRPRVIIMLLYRLAKLVALATAVLPGLILFAPVFITGKIISVKKAREALAASTVKIQAKDVVATWKLLVALVVAPSLYALYDIVLCIWAYYNRIQGYVPEYVPLWTVFLFGMTFFPIITFAALRFGEVGMDIFKSLRPLVVALDPSSNNIFIKLRETRAALAQQVMDVINTLGPEMFPDFDAARIIAHPYQDSSSQVQNSQCRESDTFSIDSIPSSPTRSLTDASIGGGSSAQGHLPKNDSFKDLSSVGLFATRPGTPNRNRSRRSSSVGGGPGGFPVQGFSNLDSQESFEEVSKKIRGAMRERAGRRRGKSENGFDEDSGIST